MCKLHWLFSIFILRIMISGSIKTFTSTVLCSRIPGLSQVQRQLCTTYPDALVALGQGHLLGVQECQHQFKSHRWNCTDPWTREVFGTVMFIGSREAAFSYAITSAGAVHAITAACGRGNISFCGCGIVPRQKKFHNSHGHQIHHTTPPVTNPDGNRLPWKWGGCSADITFGIQITRKFIDARETEGDERSLMNLHNNHVGRKIVKNLLRTDCKCHGVSGSCALKTCWKSLPPFRLIGDALLKKYNRARLVHAEKTKAGLSLVVSKNDKNNRTRRKSTTTPSQRSKRMELVYLQPSPNYCERDLNVGSMGTAGRSCMRNSSELDSCNLLCCGRGYNTLKINRTWQCHCRFRWCCTVHCDVCTEHIEEYTCK